MFGYTTDLINILAAVLDFVQTHLGLSQTCFFVESHQFRVCCSPVHTLQNKSHSGHIIPQRGDSVSETSHENITFGVIALYTFFVQKTWNKVKTVQQDQRPGRTEVPL